MKRKQVMKMRMLAIGLIAGAFAVQMVPEAEAVSALDMIQCKLGTLQYQVEEKMHTAMERLKTVAVELDAGLKEEKLDFENRLVSGTSVEKAFKEAIDTAEGDAHQTYWRAERECWKKGKATKYMSGLQERGICAKEQKAVKAAKKENRLMKKVKEARRLVKERLIHPVMEKARAAKRYVLNKMK